METPLRYGLIGCGGFGKFCLREYQKMPEIVCRSVTDVDAEVAQKAAAELGTACHASAREMLEDPKIDIVHLATPPFTHAALAMEALKNGKHVLCEKPLATNIDDARLLVETAREKGLVLAVNLIMRYNPLCAAVKSIVGSGALGKPLFATILNFAQDENLPSSHWFWDQEKSGGIFIEHGVHFFDLFEWWFGPGTLLSAAKIMRPGTSIVEAVQSTMSYGEATLGSFYHGFHQLRRNDRQDWKIVFELGSIDMNDWVPTSIKVTLDSTEAALATILKSIPDSTVITSHRPPDGNEVAWSRHTQRLLEVHAVAASTKDLPKLSVYGGMVRDLMQDQLEKIKDPSHQRLVGETNGVSSLAAAVACEALASKGSA